LGYQFNLDEILKQLIDGLNLRYKELESGNFKKIDQDYLQALYRINEFYKYESEKGVFLGKIIDINSDGRLCILTINNELLKFAFKEVSFL
jgi:BirA family biotin operon repressor/biotin-[acetyl-CoA-carboxylase] ligase